MICETLLCLMNMMGNNTYITGELQSYVQKPRYEGSWCETKWCSGPAGELRIGTKIDLTRAITVDFGILHRSYINTTRDRGVESLYMSATWKPFK